MAFDVECALEVHDVLLTVMEDAQRRDMPRAEILGELYRAAKEYEVIADEIATGQEEAYLASQT